MKKGRRTVTGIAPKNDYSTRDADQVRNCSDTLRIGRSSGSLSGDVDAPRFQDLSDIGHFRPDLKVGQNHETMHVEKEKRAGRKTLRAFSGIDGRAVYAETSKLSIHPPIQSVNTFRAKFVRALGGEL
jgi:hypothetical protein